MINSDQNPHQQQAAFEVEFVVRDYECDLAHVVNNAVYMNYLEHSRHEFLKSIGIDFAAFARKKIGLVVVRLEVDFKTSLVSGDKFVVITTMQHISRVRLQFNQNIYRQPDRKLVLNAIVIGTAVNERNRPEIPPEMEAALDSFKIVKRSASIP